MDIRRVTVDATKPGNAVDVVVAPSLDLRDELGVTGGEDRLQNLGVLQLLNVAKVTHIDAHARTTPASPSRDSTSAPGPRVTAGSTARRNHMLAPAMILSDDLNRRHAEYLPQLVGPLLPKD